jgi:hypothetical protein
MQTSVITTAVFGAVAGMIPMGLACQAHSGCPLITEWAMIQCEFVQCALIGALVAIIIRQAICDRFGVQTCHRNKRSNSQG